VTFPDERQIFPCGNEGVIRERMLLGDSTGGEWSCCSRSGSSVL